MEINNNSNDKDSMPIYPSILINDENANNENENLLNLTIESIFKNNSRHYLCSNCKKFPFIEFCKDYKTIKYTCFCRINEKILIRSLIDDKNNNYLITEKSFSSTILKLLSSTTSVVNNVENYNSNIINIEGFICLNHNFKFKYFCKKCLENICEECFKNNHNEHNIIKLEDFEKDNKEKIKKIEEKLKKNL